MILRVFTTILLLLVSGALLAEQGMVVRTAILRADSNYLAETISKLIPGTDVQLLERKGGWQKVTFVKKAGATSSRQTISGWLRGYQVRTNIIKEPGGPVSISKKEGGVLTGLSGLSKSTANLFGRNKPKNQNSVVATIGVRGLSEQDLANAKPDMQEFSVMKQYAANDQQIKAFAKVAKLKSYKVPELADPAKKKKKKKKRKKKD